MSDSIHVFGGSFGGDAYVEKDGLAFDGFADIVYVGFQVYWPAATLAAWASAYFLSPLFFQCFDSFPHNIDFLNLDAPLGTFTLYQDDYLGDLSAGVPPVGDAWHKIEWQQDPTNGTGPFAITIDGTIVGSNTFGPGSPFGPVDRTRFGATRFLGAPPNGDAYFGEIRVGTSPGAFDKFHFQPATAPDLSAFESVVGSVTLDTAPSAPPPWGGSTPPTPVSAVASNLNVIVTFDQALDPASVPDPAQFDVKVNGVSQTVVSVSISGDDVTLVMAAPITRGAVVTVDYTYP